MKRPPENDDRYQTLLGLVNCYSPSGEEAGAVAHLVERMAALGYEQSHVDAAGNAIGVIGKGPRQIVLLGHIDTVPGKIAVINEGDNLYGRGSTDAKGPLAAFVDAAAQIGSIPGWQLVVIGAVDEERNSTGARYIKDRFSPDFAIIGEPSRWNRITLGYKGCAWARITVRKSESHAAGQKGTAPEEAVALWEKLQSWERKINIKKEKIFDQVSTSLSALASGSDGFQGWAQLDIQARLPKSLSPSEWLNQMNALLAPAEVEGRGYAIPAYRSNKNNLLVRAFLGAIRETGGQPGFVLKSGTADLNIVAPTWGCPAVAYGPGDSSLDHTPDEHISLAEFDRARSVLVLVLHSLTSG